MSSIEIKIKTKNQYLKSTLNNNIIKNNNFPHKIKGENIFFRPEEADL